MNMNFNNVNIQPIRIEDIELMRKWRNNENDKGVFFNNKYITKEEQEIWYEKYKNNINDKMFMIYYDEIPVGTIALYNIDFENNIAEFGRLLIGNTIFRGKNIAFRATKLLCEYGFSKLNLNNIILEVYKKNINAFNLYKKIGFKVVKEKTINNKQVFLMELNKNKI